MFNKFIKKLLIMIISVMLANFLSVSYVQAAGETWEPVGNAGFSAGEARSISIAINDNGTPYVAYSDWANGEKATVMKYANGSWNMVGNGGISPSYASNVSIVIDNSGIPYVLYRSTLDGKVTVKKYINNSWSVVGNEGFSAGQTQWPSIAIDNTGTPYVAYVDLANNNKLTVMKYANGSWNAVGSAGFSVAEVDMPVITIDSNGTPYVVYKDGTKGYTITGVQMPGMPDIPIPGMSPQPDTVVPDTGSAGKATVMKYMNGSWTAVGSAGFSSTDIKRSDITIDGSGMPYVVYNDNSGNITVMRYTNGNWAVVGSENFAVGVNKPNIKIDSSGIPYVLYDDPKNSQKDSVMRYVNGNWSVLGDPNFTAQRAIYLSMAIDSNGNIYVAYNDENNPDPNNYGGKATVKKIHPSAVSTVTTVATVSSISDINVANGTSLGNVSLPSTVDITLSDNTTTSAAVTWDGGNPAYDGNTAGTYTFTGTIALPQGVTNPNDLKATVNVVVGAGAAVPDSPSNVTATVSGGRAIIKFTPPANTGGSPIIKYIVTANPGGLTATGTKSPIMITGLQSGVTYTFTIKAVNAIGESVEVNVGQ